ncbi:MAG: metal ABC transporter substrate-binding protein [Defluviitaleaceae bacterium]|nr:metal ABC transporter substrate-binding protein [Defluviitaleaceae bacterium]
MRRVLLLISCLMIFAACGSVVEAEVESRVEVSEPEIIENEVHENQIPENEILENEVPENEVPEIILEDIVHEENTSEANYYAAYEALYQNIAEPLIVKATIFPQYDFIRQIGGNRVELSMLISPGSESHGFEPTPRDMLAIGNADLLVHIGGHKDEWVQPILSTVNREDMPTIALLDLVETIVVQHHMLCDEEDCGHLHHIPHLDHYDEHVWTCPRNAIIIVGELANILAEKDPSNAEYFRANAERLIAELSEIDREFAEVVANASRRTVVFGDRFPFRYFMQTYGLTYHSAFDGCCASIQVSPATIASLVTTVRAEEIPIVFHIELSNREIANVIAEEAGARTLELHSAHNISSADFNAGVTYVDIMRQNIINLREALA